VQISIVHMPDDPTVLRMNKKLWRGDLG
jgi:hypothetical protein